MHMHIVTSLLGVLKIAVSRGLSPSIKKKQKTMGMNYVFLRTGPESGLRVVILEYGRMFLIVKIQ